MELLILLDQIVSQDQKLILVGVYLGQKTLQRLVRAGNLFHKTQILQQRKQNHFGGTQCRKTPIQSIRIRNLSHLGALHLIHLEGQFQILGQIQVQFVHRESLLLTALNVVSKTATVSSLGIPAITAPRRNLLMIHATPNTSFFNKSDTVLVIVSRNDTRVEQAAESRREGVSGKPTALSLQSRPSDLQRYSSAKDNMGRDSVSGESETEVFGTNGSSGSSFSSSPAVQTSLIRTSAVDSNVRDDRSTVPARFHLNPASELPSSYQHESYETRAHGVYRDACAIESQQTARTRSLVRNWKNKDRFPGHGGFASNNHSGAVPSVNTLPIKVQMEPGNEEDTISALTEQHNQFVGSLQSRLAKLEMVHKYWERNDIKGAIGMTQKMSDNAVLADIVSILTEKPDIVTLDICTYVLPLLTSLLESEMDQHRGVSLEMLLKLVKVFGSLIYSSLSASSSVGVDIEAEQRIECAISATLNLKRLNAVYLSSPEEGELWPSPLLY